jgi:hypothetical protein
MKTYNVAGIEAYEVERTVQAHLETGQDFRIEALRIEKPHDTYYEVRCYDRHWVAIPLEAKASNSPEVIGIALAYLVSKKGCI